MRKTPLNKLGTIGKANREARQIIAEISEEKELNFCEIRLEGCTGNWPLAPAHLNKRGWYQGDVKLLSDFNQWICACVVCHDTIEHNRELTLETFKRLRP